MTISPNTAASVNVTTDTPGPCLAEVLHGLLNIPRQVSSTWLYDERGCRLFEQICTLPEYHVTRTETSILVEHSADMTAQLGAGVTLIEYGSGNGIKAHLLLEALERPAAYVPIDIAATSLARTARVIQRKHPALLVAPLCADFLRPPQLPAQLPPAARRVIYFPGSTLGNYTWAESHSLLARMRAQAGRDGLALIGIDLMRDPELLRRAYDDSAGVTAQFNLNALRHLNRQLGTDFEIARFHHRAQWVETHNRIEMHLVSTVDQTIHVGAAMVRMLRGDFVRTEYSHKYSLHDFAALAATAGWRVRRSWTDAAQWFGIQLLEPA